MALTATFSADISGFEASLKHATVTATTFDKAIKNSQRDLKREIASFSGDKVAIESARMAQAIERVGGVSKLTATEQAKVNAVMTEAVAKYRALGQEAPPHLQKIADATKGVETKTSSFKDMLGKIGPAIAAAFTVGAVVNAVSSFTEFTSKLTDMSQKTGISTSGLQKLQLAFAQSGVSIDTVTGAVIKLGQKLVGEDKSAINAMRQLGLSVDEITRMKPDQAFIKVADAVAKVENPMERARLAMDLFARGGVEVLAGLDGQLAKTTEAFDRMGLILSDEVVAAGDKFGDTLTVMKAHGMAMLGQMIAPMLPALIKMAQGFGQLAEHVVPMLGSAFKTLTLTGLGLQKWFFEFMASMADMGAKVPLLGRALGATSDATAMFRDKARAASAEIDRWNTVVPKAEVAVRKIAPVIGEYGAETNKAAEAVKKFSAEVDKLSGKTALKEAADGLKLLAAAGGPAGVLPSQMKALAETFTRAGEAARTMGMEKRAQEFELLAKTLSPVVQFQQKYNVTIGEFVALSPSYTDAIREQLSLFERQPDAINLGIVAITTYTAAWAPFKEAVKAAAKETVAFGASLKASLGNIGNVIIGALQGGGSVLKAVGATFGQALGTDLVTKFGSTITGALPKFLGDAINSIIPGVGALLGPLLGKIGGFFKSLFGGVSPEIKAARVEVDAFQATLAKTLTITQQNEAGGEKWKMTVIAVRDAFLNVGRTAAEAEALVAKLWNTDRPNEARAAIEEINKVLGLVTDEQEGLNAAIERYGFSIEQLGPAMQKQKLTEMAQELIQDFHLLTKSGIDVGLVTGKMSEKINEYLKIALKTGTEVPASMKPMLQSMLDMGMLTDADGNKLTDLTKIPFAETMTQGFNRIVDALEKLAFGLSGTLQKIGSEAGRFVDGVQRDINRIPRTIPIRFEGEYNAPNIPTGGGEGFASGTMGRYGSLLHNFKPSGESVVVHGREAILTEPQLMGFASQIAAIANGGAVTSAPQSQSVAVASPVQVYVAVDPKSGTIRVLSDAERRQVQTWINTGELTVPKRMVGGR